MSIINWIGDLFESGAKIIDDLHTSDEERAEAKRQLLIIQNQMSSKLLEYENELLKQKAEIIKVEATGQSWLQRTWRPITMLVFIALVISDLFGWLAFRLPPEYWDLFKIGLGGYVLGRSAEKVVPKIYDKHKN